MLKDLFSALRPAVVMTVLFALLLGLAYPAAVTLAGQALFPAQANGSLIVRNGEVVGSGLLAQGFAAPGYFHPRPSAAGSGYDATASSGSNLGPASKVLADRIAKDVAALHVPAAQVPADLVTTSASGLDPDVTPQGALFQVDRVATARHLPRAQIAALVRAAIEPPLGGVLGEPRVNVLKLNLALDAQHPGGA